VNHKVLVRPEMVVFDLDNTFYDYEVAHEFAFSALAAELNINVMNEGNQALDTYEKARSNVKNRLKNTASSHSRLLYLSEYFSVLNLEFNTSEILRLEATYWNVFIKNMVAFPNSIEFVDKLLSLGIVCALVTDLTSEIQYKKLETLELVNKFQCIVTSEDAGGDKSTSLPWKLLDERVSLSRFSTIWYIGDSKDDLNPTMTRPQDIGFLKTNEELLVTGSEHHCFSSFLELFSLVD